MLENIVVGLSVAFQPFNILDFGIRLSLPF